MTKEKPRSLAEHIADYKMLKDGLSDPRFAVQVAAYDAWLVWQKVLLDDIKNMDVKSLSAAEFAEAMEDLKSILKLPLEADALEIRVRAERELGKLIEDMEKQGKLKT